MNGLLKTFDLPTLCLPYYFTVNVWKNSEAMFKGVGDGDDDYDATFIGCEIGEEALPSCIGTIHFNFESWGDGIVADELTHALIHRLRVLPPHGEFLVKSRAGEMKYQEEAIATDVSRWYSTTFAELYALLRDFKGEEVLRFKKEYFSQISSFKEDSPLTYG